MKLRDIAERGGIQPHVSLTLIERLKHLDVGDPAFEASKLMEALLGYDFKDSESTEMSAARDIVIGLTAALHNLVEQTQPKGMLNLSTTIDKNSKQYATALPAFKIKCKEVLSKNFDNLAVEGSWYNFFKKLVNKVRNCCKLDATNVYKTQFAAQVIKLSSLPGVDIKDHNKVKNEPAAKDNKPDAPTSTAPRPRR